MEVAFMNTERLLQSRYLSLCLCFLAFPLGLAAEKVRVYHDQTFDFSTLRTYDWREHPEMDPALAKKAIAGDIIMSEGNEILMGRGFNPDDVSPNFYITFFVKGERYKQPTVIATSWYYGAGPSFSTYSESIYRQFVDGALVIDIVDAKENRLVWRASYQDRLSDWKERHKVIMKVVRDAFKEFPPKPKK
jgi:hypothetical protein